MLLKGINVQRDSKDSLAIATSLRRCGLLYPSAQDD